MFKNILALAIFFFTVFVAVFSFYKQSKYEVIRVKGSDSEVNLVQSLAENYMDMDSLTSIGVTGGGSGVGISALINSKTDLANSSRFITEEELHFAKKRGVNPYAIIFALDALAIIVNEDNLIESITLEELSKIYSGKIRNWSELGGKDEDIILYGRQSSSGTYIYFREAVVKDEYHPSKIGMSGTAQIVDAIRGDKKSIGYVSSGYLNESVLRGVKAVKIKADNHSEAISPLDASNIIAGEYPITRPLLQYTDGQPKGKLLSFILYQFSPEGSAAIQSNGFYPTDTEKTKALLLNSNSELQ